MKPNKKPDYTIWALIVVVAVVAVLTISLSVTYYKLLLYSPGKISQPWWEVAYWLPGFGAMPSESKQNFLSFVINALLLFDTLFTIVVTLVSQRRKESALEKSAGIKKILIKENERGKADVKIMNDAYQGASRVMIFSGDFDWIVSEQVSEIKDTMKKLAGQGKLELYSDKNVQVVKAALGGEYNTFKPYIKFSDSQDTKLLRCSLVEKDNQVKFLYKQPIMEDGVENQYVCIVRSYNEAEYLVKLLQKLVTALGAKYERNPD